MSAIAYERPKLSAGQERAVQLDLFGFLVKLRMRDVITAREAAEILRVSPDFIRDLISLGTFETFELKAKGKKKSAPEYRLTVKSFLIYVARTSTLSPEDWHDLVATFIDKLDVRSLDLVLDLATRRKTRLTR